MPRTALVNALLLDPEAEAPAPGGLVIADGRIERRLGVVEPPPAEASWVDLGGRALAPGFLDLHYHGELITGLPADAAGALARTGRALLRDGVTGYLPTTVAWPAMP
jgi:N-acetylglucosamine-6-phosphate deacetylase